MSVATVEPADGKPGLEFAWRTDQGRVRARNEDAVAVDPALGLILVADGMGGANAGDVASRLAVETILNLVREQTDETPSDDPMAISRLAARAVAHANRVIWEEASARPDRAGMGTTIVFGMIAGGQLIYAYVGDSRIYRLREGRLEQLSHDHSLIQTVVDQGLFNSLAEARRHGISEHILTRVLGSEPAIEVPTARAPLRPGDLLLFCTDGLTGRLNDEMLFHLLTEAAGQTLDRVTTTAVELANERGGQDNITLALVRVTGLHT